MFLQPLLNREDLRIFNVASQGDSVEEAKINLKEAVECHVETMVEQGDIELLLDKNGNVR